MRGVNKVTLVGNAGQDPEVRVTQGGARIASLSLATNREWKDRQGHAREETEWHRLTFFGKLAEIVEQWVHKGDRLYVEGRIHYSQTDGDDGVTRYWTEIVVNELVMLGTAGGGRKPARASSGGRAAARQEQEEPVSEPHDDLPF